MAEISKITLPSGNTYDIKDATARQMISGGVSFVVAWDGGVPTVANIPAGVVVRYNNTNYTGTLDADDAQAGAFYLVKSSSQPKSTVNYIHGCSNITVTVDESKWLSQFPNPGETHEIAWFNNTTWKIDTSGSYSTSELASQYGITITGSPYDDSTGDAAFTITSSSSPLDVYDEYVPVGTTGSKTWEKIGDTQVNLANVVTGVTLTKQTDTVIGSDATFTVTQPTITLATGSSGDVTVATGGTTKYMAATASGAAVTPTTTYVKATASGGGAAWNSKDQVTAVTGYSNPSTDTFVKSVSAETNKNLVTTTVPNVTAAGSASTWNFAMGSGDASETLIISGGNSTAPTLGTAITVATGATSTTGTGDAVVTGVTIGSSASAITALGTPDTDTVIGSDATFTNTQPTVALATDSSSGTGKVQVATGISSVTQPTIALSAESASATGRAEFAQSVTTTKLSGSASGANTAWNSKDQVTVLKNSTSLDVTKGNA